MDIAALREKARNLEASVRIGKFGINQAAVAEVSRQLKAKKLVKVKILANAGIEDVDTTAKDLAEKTNSVLIQRVGKVIVLYKT